MNNKDLVNLTEAYQHILIKENEQNSNDVLDNLIHELIGILSPELKDDVDYESAVEEIKEKVSDVVHNISTQYLNQEEGDEDYGYYGESSKKVNPWAVAKSIAKKEHLGPKKEEKIVKAVKKSAKKYGKKITSDKVEKKK